MALFSQSVNQSASFVLNCSIFLWPTSHYLLSDAKEGACTEHCSKLAQPNVQQNNSIKLFAILYWIILTTVELLSIFSKESLDSVSWLFCRISIKRNLISLFWFIHRIIFPFIFFLIDIQETIAVDCETILFFITGPAYPWINQWRSTPEIEIFPGKLSNKFSSKIMPFTGNTALFVRQAFFTKENNPLFSAVSGPFTSSFLAAHPPDFTPIMITIKNVISTLLLLSNKPNHLSMCECIHFAQMIINRHIIVNWIGMSYAFTCIIIMAIFKNWNPLIREWKFNNQMIMIRGFPDARAHTHT